MLFLYTYFITITKSTEIKYNFKFNSPFLFQRLNVNLS